jgi:hypothetical protein
LALGSLSHTFLPPMNPETLQCTRDSRCNLLEHGVFSLSTEPPFDPTLIRLPGFPIFIAAVYAIFGHGNDMAVRIAEAFVDTATCVVAAALSVSLDRGRSESAAQCDVDVCIGRHMSICGDLRGDASYRNSDDVFHGCDDARSHTSSLDRRRGEKTLVWWVVTGLLAGASVMLRPDSGLFALGIGLAIVAVELFSRGEKLSARLFGAGWKGAAFSIAFLVVLLPWTIRNYEVFKLFQPLSPAHAEMPGEFVGSRLQPLVANMG